MSYRQVSCQMFVIMNLNFILHSNAIVIKQKWCGIFYVTSKVVKSKMAARSS